MSAECAMIEWNGHGLALDARRAIYWPGAGALLIADLHLGKGAAFRAAGVPVPRGSTVQDLRCLSAIIREYAPSRLLILGDLLHAPASARGETRGALVEWRSEHPALEILVVRGNHDRWAGDAAPDLFSFVDPPYAFRGVRLLHEPDGDESAPSIAGHMQPAVAVDAAPHGRIRARCFLVGPRSILMPAFGSFTGSSLVRPAGGDRVFVAHDGSVLEIAVRPSRPRSSRSSR